MKNLTANVKTEFVLVTEWLGKITLKSTEWCDVAGELYDKGYVNMGKVKVVERTYHLVDEVPHLVNTNY